MTEQRAEPGPKPWSEPESEHVENKRTAGTGTPPPSPNPKPAEGPRDPEYTGDTAPAAENDDQRRTD